MMKKLLKTAICICLLIGSLSASAFSGRIAVISDGNFIDSDDIAANPISIALIRMFEQQGKLVHYTYACDTRNSYAGRELKLKNGLDAAASLWGGFNTSVFFNGKSQRQASIANLTAAINNSSATDSLWISEAGEPDIIYLAMNAANQVSRQYVKIVTHHPNNDIGNVYDLIDIENLAGTPTTMVVRIQDQNLNLKKKLVEYSWMNNYGDPRVQLLWDQGNIAEQDANYTPIRTYFDPSDAGIIWYILTGNDASCTVAKIKDKIDQYIGTVIVPSNPIVHMQKSNATGFAIDGGAGGADNQPVVLWTDGATNVNQKWEEIDRGSGYYSYVKLNTNYCLDGGSGAVKGQLVKLKIYNTSSQDQQWKKISVGSNKFVLEKRNAVGFSIDGGTGATNGRQLKLWTTGLSNGNQQWLFSNTSASRMSAKGIVAERSENNLASSAVSVSPNPATTEIVISGLGEGNFTAIIFDSKGKMVGSYSNKKTISVSNLSAGTYVVKIGSAKLNKSIKFIKLDK